VQSQFSALVQPLLRTRSDIGLVGLWWVSQRDRPLPDIAFPTALETDSNKAPYAEQLPNENN
jgi:hypothetical protein